MKRALTYLSLLIVAGYVTGFGSFLWRISEPTVIASSAFAARTAHQLLYGADVPSPITTGSIPDKPTKSATTKKPPEPDAITRAWRKTNYILALCWLDDHCREHDDVQRRKP